MEVCIDIQSAIAQQAGVGRYTRELVKHLGAEAGQDRVTLFFFDFTRHGTPLCAPPAQEKAFRWLPGRLVQAAWKRHDWPPFDLFAGRHDLYHFPNFVLPPLRRGKAVVTIHDMSFARYPEFAELKNLKFLNARIRETARRADAVITDSLFSAGEIRELLGVEASRIHPIHLGISPDFTAPAAAVVADLRRRLGLERPYLLTVGTLEPRKNVSFLVEVLEAMESFDGDLVIAGMRGWKSEPTLERMRSSRCANRIRYLEYVAGADLPALYAGAELFLLASFYEGFGFPPLEAMACGTPVLSSAGGSLAEVLGETAVVMDAFEAEAWAQVAQRTIDDTDGRRRRVDAGRRHAARYRWQSTAQRTWEVYRKVLA